MSRRKHVTLGLNQEVEPPSESQRIVQIVGPRGGNIVEVSYPGGQQTLVLLPSKFNKKLWLKRGGYVIIDEGLASSSSQPSLSDMANQSEEQAGPSSTQADTATSSSQAAASGNKITGTITAVLYDAHIKQLKKQGAWPSEYLQGRLSAAGTQGPGNGAAANDAEEEQDGLAADSHGEEESDDGLPAIHRNTNRKVIVHYVSDDESEDEG